MKEQKGIPSLEGSAQEQYVKMLTNSLYGVQATRVRLDNRIFAFEKNHGEQYADVVDLLKERLSVNMNSMEKNIAADLGKAVSKLPIIKWLEEVRGIGPRLSGSIIGMLSPIERFRTISALWSYVGYSVIMGCQGCIAIYLEGKEKKRFLDRQAIRRWEVYERSKKYKALVDRIGDDPAILDVFIARHKGAFLIEKYEESEKKLCSCDSPNLQSVAPDRKYYGGLILPYNTFLKDTCWRIGGQFIKQGDFYRTWYEAYKEQYLLRRPEMSAGRNDNSARRATVKLFLSHLWVMWRKAHGLPTGMTYLQHRLGEEYAKQHTLIEPPYADIYGDK